MSGSSHGAGEPRKEVIEDGRSVIRVTEEWQRAGVHYIRTDAMCRGFTIPLEYEFAEDTPEDTYILVLDGIIPVSTCRLRYPDEKNGKIERVVTLASYRGQHYGAMCIREAEKWMAEKGVATIRINARKAAAGFYQKLGYEADWTQVSGSGDFVCVMMYKHIGIGRDQ